MTINITPEIEDAYRQFLAEQVDSFVGGQPIYRRDTAPYSTMRFSGLVDFAAGHQAARAALATELLREVMDALTLAKNDLVWYRHAMLEADNPVDDKVEEQVDAALAKLREQLGEQS